MGELQRRLALVFTLGIPGQVGPALVGACVCYGQVGPGHWSVHVFVMRKVRGPAWICGDALLFASFDTDCHFK